MKTVAPGFIIFLEWGKTIQIFKKLHKVISEIKYFSLTVFIIINKPLFSKLDLTSIVYIQYIFEKSDAMYAIF